MFPVTIKFVNEMSVGKLDRGQRRNEPNCVSERKDKRRRQSAVGVSQSGSQNRDMSWNVKETDTGVQGHGLD